MGNLVLALFILLLCFCGPIGWVILLSVLILFICVATESLWLLLIIIAIMVLLFFSATLPLGKKRVPHKTIKNEKDSSKILELNNETISELVKLVGANA